MSIIYDALKKVEKTNNRESQVISGANRAKPDFRVYLLYLSVLVLGFVLMNLLFKMLTPSQKSYKEYAKPLPSAVDTQRRNEAVQDTPVVQNSAEDFTPEEPSLPSVDNLGPQAPSAALVLNGIFFSQDAGVALINNQIVKVGDAIGRAIVREITQEGVVLDLEGSAVKLSTHNQ